jgi:hypothetical protein
MVKIETVHASYRNCHIYGAAALRRAVAFLGKHNLDPDPEVFWHYLANQMFQANPLALVVVAVEDGRVVGHLIAEVQDNYGFIIATVLQWEMDKGIHHMQKGKAIKEGWSILNGWAKMNNAKKIRGWAVNKDVAQMFEKLAFEDSGFTIMDMRIPESQVPEV